MALHGPNGPTVSVRFGVAHRTSSLTRGLEALGHSVSADASCRIVLDLPPGWAVRELERASERATVLVVTSRRPPPRRTH